MFKIFAIFQKNEISFVVYSSKFMHEKIPHQSIKIGTKLDIKSKDDQNKPNYYKNNF